MRIRFTSALPFLVILLHYARADKILCQQMPIIDKQRWNHITTTPFPSPQHNQQLQQSTQYASIVGEGTIKLGREVNFSSVSTKDATTLTVHERSTIERAQGLSIARVDVIDNLGTSSWLVSGSTDSIEYSCDIPLKGSRIIKQVILSLDGVHRIPICSIATQDDMNKQKWSSPPAQSLWTDVFIAHANTPDEVIRKDGEGFLNGRHFLIYRSFYKTISKSVFLIHMINTEGNLSKSLPRSLLRAQFWRKNKLDIPDMYIVIPGGINRRYECQMPFSDSLTEMDIFFQSEL